MKRESISPGDTFGMLTAIERVKCAKGWTWIWQCACSRRVYMREERVRARSAAGWCSCAACFAPELERRALARTALAAPQVYDLAFA